MKRKRQLMTLSQLQTSIAVAKYNSFSEAALQLDMSQSAVSNAIATLESDLGVVLFSHGRHGANLTPVGKRVVALARQMMQLQEEILKEANLARSLRGGEVRITSFRSITTHILPEVMAQFGQRFPEISISIAEHFNHQRIEDDLRQGRADIGLIDANLSDEFETWELFQDEFVVLLPPSFQQTAKLSWEHLNTYPFIMAADENNCDEQVYAHCAAFGKTLDAAYHLRADSTIVSMVARGLGATIIPRLAAEPIPTSVQVFSLPVPLFRIIRVAVLANALLSPPVFAFLEMLKASDWFAAQTE